MLALSGLNREVALDAISSLPARAGGEGEAPRTSCQFGHRVSRTVGSPVSALLWFWGPPPPGTEGAEAVAAGGKFTAFKQERQGHHGVSPRKPGEAQPPSSRPAHPTGRHGPKGQAFRGSPRGPLQKPERLPHITFMC